MRSLFAKFLVWFWAGLTVLLAAELMLETHSLQEGLALQPGGSLQPMVYRADLARDALARGGLPALDSLIRGMHEDDAIDAYRVDGTTPMEGAQADIARAGRAALRARHGTLVETRGGLYVAWPIGDAGGRPIALVIHPPVRAEEAAERLLPFLPEDLGLRALLTLLLGGIGCFFLARYVTAPIKRLREATRRIAAGDLSARSGAADRTRRDELEDLGRDFDRMAGRLESLVGAQRRLLADISHELRSPLARMNVALALLRERLGDDPDGMLARLELESQRLDRLIGGLLTLSRAEIAEPVPASESVELVALARGIAADARFEAAGDVGDVRVTGDPAVEVRGVPGLLRSALDNVVRNAARHTAAGTAVEIDVARVDGHARVTVRDHGPGVPADQLERIFEPFHRVEGTDRPKGGTGLGLAITRRILAQHGGEVTAAPVPGGGLCVTLRLPAG